MQYSPPLFTGAATPTPTPTPKPTPSKNETEGILSTGEGGGLAAQGTQSVPAAIASAGGISGLVVGAGLLAVGVAAYAVKAIRAKKAKANQATQTRANPLLKRQSPVLAATAGPTVVTRVPAQLTVQRERLPAPSQTVNPTQRVPAGLQFAKGAGVARGARPGVPSLAATNAQRTFANASNLQPDARAADLRTFQARQARVVRPAAGAGAAKLTRFTNLSLD